MPTPIYLDHNATTPLLPEVADVMRDCWERRWANPASQHEFGREASRALDGAQDRIGDLLGAGDDAMLFTSGGTESNNLAILSHIQPEGASASMRPSHIVISAIEHPSITSLADELQRQGHDVDRIPADVNGVVRVDALRDMLRPETAVVAVMLANNETGVIQPVAEFAAICNERRIPLHTDATQAAGKISIDFCRLGAATMTIAAHKFHGPVGIGGLICRDGVELCPQLFGGFQQGGLRPGTESVALAMGMCRALDFGSPIVELHEHTARINQRADRMRELRDRFEQTILAGYPSAVVIGAAAERLPNTSSIAFVGLDRQMLFMALDQCGVACSTGSACASGSSEPSPVLRAMGCDKIVLNSALRFSFGATTSGQDSAEAARRILRCCNDLG